MFAQRAHLSGPVSRFAFGAAGECACAFAIKAGSDPDCREEFWQDHDTVCAEETLEECLVVVMRAAQARSDTELAEATAAALQCVRSEASDPN